MHKTPQPREIARQLTIKKLPWTAPMGCYTNLPPPFNSCGGYAKRSILTENYPPTLKNYFVFNLLIVKMIYDGESASPPRFIDSGFRSRLSIVIGWLGVELFPSFDFCICRGRLHVGSRQRCNRFFE
jgi:hypothetical protein